MTEHFSNSFCVMQVDAFRGRESEIVAECLHGDFPFKPHDRSDIPSADNAVFCIIMRGGVESSRALNDAFLGGCIPVFVGPPFHTLPFASQIAYEDFAVFFELQDLAWVPKVRFPHLSMNLVCNLIPLDFLISEVL